MNNLIRFCCGDDFAAGTSEQLLPDASVGRGALTMAPGAGEGTFTSPVIHVDDFSAVVMSWNTDVPEGTWSESFCRVQDQDGVWSDWLSWGVWGVFVERASRSSMDGGCASVSADTLDMKEGRTGKALQLRCVLHREAGAEAPTLRLLAATTRLSAEDRLKNTEPKTDIELEAPAYCQSIRDPNIGFGMCSPTSTTVLMNYCGEDLLPEESALACWDHSYEGFGNWAFTMAMAGSYGFESWVTFSDGDGIRALLQEGYPLGASVAYSDTHEKATKHAPFMENTPGFTNGHLLAIRGLEVDENGREWVLVCDSYGRFDSRAYRRYPMEQFLHAWGGILYVVRPRLNGSGKGSPFRIPAKLKKTDFGDEFVLVVDDREMLLDPLFNGSRKHCTGIVAYSVDDPYNYPTTANRPFSYTKVTINGNILLPAKALLNASPLGDRAVIRVFVITNRGVTYTADVTREDL